MSRTLQSFLVGSHFVPPAKALLEALPAGARLRLSPCDGVHEEINPYDSGAIKVYVEPGEIIWSAVSEEQLVAMGSSIDELKGKEKIMLGHVAASGGKPLGKAQAVLPGLVGNVEVALAVESSKVETADVWESAKVRALFQGEFIIIELDSGEAAGKG